MDDRWGYYWGYVRSNNKNRKIETIGRIMSWVDHTELKLLSASNRDLHEIKIVGNPLSCMAWIRREPA